MSRLAAIRPSYIQYALPVSNLRSISFWVIYKKMSSQNQNKGQYILTSYGVIMRLHKFWIPQPQSLFLVPGALGILRISWNLLKTLSIWELPESSGELGGWGLIGLNSLEVKCVSDESPQKREVTHIQCQKCYNFCQILIKYDEIKSGNNWKFYFWEHYD